MCQSLKCKGRNITSDFLKNLYFSASMVLPRPISSGGIVELHYIETYVLDMFDSRFLNNAVKGLFISCAGEACFICGLNSSFDAF